MNIAANRRFLLLAGKLLVVALTLYLLWKAIFTAPDTFLNWQTILQNALASPFRWLFIVTAILIPFNWGFEAKKWQLLGQKLEPISFLRAYRSVMVGLTLGFITPNRLGDYAPKKVKQSVTGNGNVSKEQVASMLVQILKIQPDPKMFDATDALSVALCHHYQKGNNAKSGAKSWKGFLTDNPDRVASK